MQTLVADFGSQNTVDFVKLGKSGCVGVILRATRSNEMVDSLYRCRRDAAHAVGLKVGAYAFNTGEAPEVQVARFMAETEGPDPDVSYWLDLERNPSGGQMTLGMTLEFLDRTDQKVGRCCGLYSGDVIKTLITRATAAQRNFLAAHPLWGCEYGPRWKNVDANGHPLPWVKPLLWQYTGDGIGPEPQTLDGLEASADLSVFDGTPDELRAQWLLPGIPAGKDPLVA